MYNKVAIIGTAFGNIEDTVKERCCELGKWLSKNNFLIITGACPGISYLVAKEAINNGGKVIGYSPGQNKEEHDKLFNFPNDGFSDLIFLRSKYEVNEVYFRRSLNVIHEADIVISIDGGRGTMSELFLATFFSKKIICTDFSIGATKEFIKIHKQLEKSKIMYGEEIVIARDIEEIKTKIMQLSKKGEINECQY